MVMDRSMRYRTLTPGTRRAPQSCLAEHWYQYVHGRRSEAVRDRPWRKITPMPVWNQNGDGRRRLGLKWWFAIRLRGRRKGAVESALAFGSIWIL